MSASDPDLFSLRQQVRQLGAQSSQGHAQQSSLASSDDQKLRSALASREEARQRQQVGDLTGAVRGYQVARDLLEKLTRDHRSHDALDDELLVVERAIADIWRERGDEQQALQVWARATAASKQRVREPRREVHAATSLLIRTELLGNALRAAGRLRAALAEYGAGLAIGLEVLTDVPNNVGSRRNLCVMLRHVATVNQQCGYIRAARTAARELVAIMNNLAELGDSATKVQLAFDSWLLGAIRGEAGDFRGAVAELYRAIAILEGGDVSTMDETEKLATLVRLHRQTAQLLSASASGWAAADHGRKANAAYETLERQGRPLPNDLRDMKERISLEAGTYRVAAIVPGLMSALPPLLTLALLSCAYHVPWDFRYWGLALIASAVLVGMLRLGRLGRIGAGALGATAPVLLIARGAISSAGDIALVGSAALCSFCLLLVQLGGWCWSIHTVRSRRRAANRALSTGSGARLGNTR